MENIYRYTGYTLIDITKTDVLTSELSNTKARNQQRNWETVNQILSLRAQLLQFDYVNQFTANLARYSFGINFKGKHKIWQFSFAVEREDIFNIQQDRYGKLKDDFSVTPVILGLNETIQLDIPLFFASGPNKNIYFIAEKI